MFIKVIITLFIGLFSLTLQTLGQNKEIVEIHFNLSHSRRNPGNHVTIEFQKFFDSVNVHIISTPIHRSTNQDSTKRDYSFNIPKEIFDKVATSVKAINCTDILNDSSFIPDDGATCEIEFGNYETDIKYSVWAPEYKTQQRRLQPFLDVCLLILQTVGLNSDKNL